MELVRLDRRTDPLAAVLRRYLLTGDETAMEAVVRETRPRLLAAARRIGRSQDAEDAVQTAYIALVRHRGAELGAPVLPWLLTATVRAAYRRKAVHASEDRLAQRLAQAPPQEAGPLADLVGAEEAARIRDDLAVLPPALRDAIVLRCFQGLSTAETALLLGTTGSAVRVRLHRARAVLRARWAPRSLLGFVALPWFGAGLGRSAATGATTSTGFVMTKSAVACLVLVVAAASAYVGARLLAPDDRPGADVASRDGVGTPPPAATASPARESRDVRPDSPPPGAERTPRARDVSPPPAGPSPATAPRAVSSAAAPQSAATKRERLDRMTREYLDALKIPAGVASEAKALGVGTEALQTMYAAELLVHYRDQAPRDEDLARAADDRLAALAARGDEGFLAVAANARGNPENSSRVDVMAKATWRAGLESSLIDWLRAGPPQATVVAPLRALGGVDSADVRAFLRESLTTYADHASNFAAAAAALGALHDPGAASLVAGKLRMTNWSGLRASLLDSLGRMGGEDAKRVLVDYLRDPAGAAESAALEALALIDPAAARAEVEALLSASSPNKLEGEEPARVRRFLGR